MTTDTTPQEKIEAAVKELGLTFECKFVPFSQSRNKAEKHPSLNWLVTLKRGNGSMSFDYGAGCGHCPSYNQRTYNTVDGREAVKQECEIGKAFTLVPGESSRSPGHSRGDVWESGRMPSWKNKSILPKDADIIHSLAIDASVLDSGSFEEWASEFGYETDSRAAEAIYNVCLQQALQLRRLVGDEGLRILQTASQDY